MAQDAARKLDAGIPFPELALSLIDGSSLRIPSDLSGRWAVLLLYRGHW